MCSNLDEYVNGIVKQVNAATGERFACVGIEALAAGDAKDSPSTFFVPGVLAVDDAILKISNETFPNSVRLATEKARLARRVLSEDLAEAIPSPIFEGQFVGRSFAIWPKYRSISGYKIVRAVQKRLLFDNLFTWLQDVSRVSIIRSFGTDTVDRRCRLPLEYVRDNKALTTNVRSLADLALRRLENGEWDPVLVLQHSDFWLGNILLPRRSQRFSRNKFKFFVIDWGGSFIDGAPGLDMVCLCMSANITLQRTRTALLNYVRSIKINPEALVFEIIVGLGLIGTNLNQFPEERYADLCESTVDYLRIVGIHH